MDWCLLWEYFIIGVMVNLVSKLLWLIITVVIDMHCPELRLYDRLDHWFTTTWAGVVSLSKKSLFWKIITSRPVLMAIDIIGWPILPFVLVYIPYDAMKINLSELPEAEP